MSRPSERFRRVVCEEGLRLSACEAINCEVNRKGYFMCRPHWFTAPVALRSRFNAAVKRCNRLERAYTNDREFLEAAAEIVEFVATKEGVPIANVFRKRLDRMAMEVTT